MAAATPTATTPSTSTGPTSSLDDYDHNQNDVDLRAEAVYALTDLQSPVLSGVPLRVVTALLESARWGSLLRARILTLSGFVAFRQRALAEAEAGVRNVRPCALPLHAVGTGTKQGVEGGEVTWERIGRLYEALFGEGGRVGGRRATVGDYRAAYATGRVTPSDAVRALLPLMAAANEAPAHLNAVLSVEEKDVVAQAAAATRRWKVGEVLGVMDGVPYVVKTSMDATGWVTGCGARILRGEQGVSQVDADAVRALRQGGGVLIGKGAMDELGIGVRGFSAWDGQIGNPHGERWVAGGSSGGCAAAVAAGLCPVAVGSDSGGSVRIPAACCGVYGLKPTFARVSVWGGVLTERREDGPEEVSPLLHVGPMAACARDLVLAYYALAGFAPHRSIKGWEEWKGVGGEAAPEGLGGVQGVRVGVCRPWVRDTEMVGRRAVERFLGQLEQAGAVRVPVVVPDLEDLRVGMAVSIIRKRVQQLKELKYYDEKNTGNFGLDVRSKLRMAAEFTDADEERARVVRGKAMQYCTETLFGEGGIDIMVTPALGVETPLVPGNLKTGLADVRTDSAMMRFMIYANMTGIPACVIPIGRSARGMPVAVQVMAAPWQEQRLLEVCVWAEKVFGVHKAMTPKHCFNALDHAGRGVEAVGAVRSPTSQVVDRAGEEEG